MINKIINWTLGGFFRTLGKFLLFLCIGILIAIFLSNNNFKLPHLGLFGIVVKADTLSISSAQYNVYVDSNVANGCSSGEGQGYKNLDVVSDLRTYTSSVSTISAISRIDYTAQTSSTYNAGVTYNLEVIQSYNPKDFSTWSPSSWSYSFEGSTSTSTSGLNTANINSFSCYIEDISNNNYQIKLHCIFEPKVNLKLIFFRVVTGCHTTQISYFNTYTLKVESVTGTEGAINNQTTIIQNNFNETNENINNINETLNDDDTSDTASDFMDFIDNFTLSSDNYIAQIILLPINLLDSLIDMGTDDLCTEFHGKQVCLPNGQRILWQKNYSGCHINSFFCATNTKRDNFKNFINLVLGGFIIYKLLVKLAKTIENALDPTKTYIEVMKL